MLKAINKYPSFDLSEIIPDPEFAIKKYKPLTPVKAGNYVPDFVLNPNYANWQQFYNGSETHGPILLRYLLDKPLVITFYSHHWKNLGVDHLKQLNAIQHDIKANGGNLLIVSEEREDTLQAIAWEHSLSLNFYYDATNEIARKFRTFSDENPAWSRFSGVDENVALLATYVIDPSRQVIYDHINLNFDEAFPAQQIISNVYVTTLLNNQRKSA